MIKKELNRGDCFVTKILGTPTAFYEVLDVNDEKVKMTLISEPQEHHFAKATLWFPKEYVDGTLKPIASPMAKMRFSEALIIMSGYYASFIDRLGQLQMWESTDLKVGDVILINEKKEKAFGKVTEVNRVKGTYGVTMLGVEEPTLMEMTLYSEATMEDELRAGQVFVHIPDEVLQTQQFLFESMERNLRTALGLPEWGVR